MGNKSTKATDEFLEEHRFVESIPIIGYIASGVYLARSDDKGLSEAERDKERAEAKRAAARATHSTLYFTAVNGTLGYLATSSFVASGGWAFLGAAAAVGLIAEGAGILSAMLIETSYTEEEVAILHGKEQTDANAVTIVKELAIGTVTGAFMGGTKYAITKRYGAPVGAAAVGPIEEGEVAVDRVIIDNFVGVAPAPAPMVTRITRTLNFMVRGVKASVNLAGAPFRKVYRIITTKAGALNFLLDVGFSSSLNAADTYLLNDLVKANNAIHDDADAHHRRLMEVDSIEQAEQNILDASATRGPQKKHQFMLSINGCIDLKGGEAVAAAMHVASSFHGRAYVTASYSEHAFIQFEDSQTDEKGVVMKMLKSSCNDMTEDCYLSINKSMRGFRPDKSVYMTWETKSTNAAVWQVEIYQESFITFKLIGKGGSSRSIGDELVGGYLAAISEYPQDNLTNQGGVTEGRSGVHLAVINKPHPTPSSFMIHIPPPDQFWWMAYKGKYQLSQFVPPALDLEGKVPTSVIMVPSVEHDGMHLFVDDRRYDVIPQKKEEFIVYEEHEDRTVGTIPAQGQLELGMSTGLDRTAKMVRYNTVLYTREWWWDVVGFYVCDKYDNPNDYHFVQVKIEDGKLMWVTRGNTKWTLWGETGSTDKLIRGEDCVYFKDGKYQNVTWDANGDIVVGINQHSDYHKRVFWEDLVGRYRYNVEDETGATISAYATISMAIGLNHLHLMTPSGICMKLEPWDLEELRVVARNDVVKPKHVRHRRPDHQGVLQPMDPPKQEITDIVQITRAHARSFAVTLHIDGFGLLERR